MSPITTICAACLALAPTSTNLDFRNGDLDGWIGDGFYLTTADPRGPRGVWAVCSSDAGSPKRKGMIRHVFVVPHRVTEIRCRAYAGLPNGATGSDQLDILLLRPGKIIVPKEVRTDSIWLPSHRLLPRCKNGPREYVWDVSALGGQTVQLVVADFDERPGYFVFCSGFRLIRNSAALPRQTPFDQSMVTLADEHRLAPMKRYDSTHFMAISNAGHRFTLSRLQWCEHFRHQFFEHFAENGFETRRPGFRLKIVAFASPKGFDAYFKKQMPSHMTGIYVPADNRLILYDLRSNRDLISSKNRAMKMGRRIDALNLAELKEKVDRLAEEIAVAQNLATVLHETAHLLSFNCGILNRNGDVPLWLVEGMACYCEAATKDGWAGFGASNRSRMDDLARYRKQIVPLKSLIQSDNWGDTKQTTLVRYAQSWALFCWLMETRPEKLAQYCRLIYPRRAAEHRLTDFAQIFGADWNRLESEYRRFVNRLISSAN